ncbi:MAG: hydrogenase small subunit [Anaeromyxobacter sp.]
MNNMPQIAEQETNGVSRRDFIKVCSAAAAAVGLPAWAGEKMAETVGKKKPSVVWLHFQECTGCTESLLRTSHPDVGALILDLISVDYHETLFAAAGHQIEEALESAKAAGGYVLVVEGAIPLKDDGVYCVVGGKTAERSLVECAKKAGAVICIGSCASFGGIPASAPNPTGSVGAPEVLKKNGIDVPTITLPGCPANPYNLLGTVLQFATFKTLPALDEKARPKFAYGRVIHEDCQRRPHFQAGRFAVAFGDEGHRNGWCLYKLGCKGPQTHANCSLLDFCDVPGAWPVGIGHPCVGCTEEGIMFGKATQPGHSDTIPIYTNLPVPSNGFPEIQAEHKVINGAQSTPMTGEVAIGVASAVVGALVGAGVVASKKLSADDKKE